MRLVLWANGNRGVSCLDALVQRGYRPSLVVAHPPRGSSWYASVAEAAAALGIPVATPADPHAPAFIEPLRAQQPEVFVMAGYGPILGPAVLGIPEKLSVNLHAGRLPEYRGSSPMNWALINGETSFSLSVIRVDTGVDSGDVLNERAFPVGLDDTIVDLHRIANEQFPGMLLEVMEQIEADSLKPRKQDPTRARYWPLRFPDDGLVLWDRLTAEQVHNRVRALRPPYPGAFTFFRDRRVKLIESRLARGDFRGEPGRIYRKSEHGLLVCALDRSLWIREAVFVDDQTPLAEAAGRYETLATLHGAAMALYEGRVKAC